MFRIPWRSTSLQLYEWGEGPVCLLIHGWNGRGTQLGGIAKALAENGFRAVAVDLPGHGETRGQQTDVFEIADAVTSVVQYYQSVHALIAHSFGNVALAWLLRRGTATNAAVFICPPDHMSTLFDYYCRVMRISGPVRTRLAERVDTRLGASVWADTSPVTNVASLTVTGLVIHDRDDRELPWRFGKAVADAWPGAEFLRTQGLGHQRLLRDEAVLQQICAFLQRPGQTN
jgi:pimeloyl-ACP methyl ester carboxylesterase